MLRVRFPLSVKLAVGWSSSWNSLRPKVTESARKLSEFDVWEQKRRGKEDKTKEE